MTQHCSDKKVQSISEEITEKVCAQFQDWRGCPDEQAGFDLKTDIYLIVEQILSKNILIK